MCAHTCLEGKTNEESSLGGVLFIRKIIKCWVNEKNKLQLFSVLDDCSSLISGITWGWHMIWGTHLFLPSDIFPPLLWEMLHRLASRQSPCWRYGRKGAAYLAYKIQRLCFLLKQKKKKKNWSPIVSKQRLATAHRPWGIYEQLQAHLLTSVGNWAVSLSSRLWPVMSCANEFRDFLSLYSYSTKEKYPPIAPTCSWIIDFSFEVQMSWMKTYLDCNIGAISTSWFMVH